MFGYVRPVREELKCKDFDLYRATYCGLCRAMRRRCGLLAPLLLNFDFTFLALLLSPQEKRFTPCRGRCHANPLRALPMCQDSQALDLAADESVILAWWKLRDSAEDEGFFKGLPARLLSILLKGAYKKAARNRPEFDRAVRENLEHLRELERDKCPSIDRSADAFALLLQAAAPDTGEESKDRPMRLLLYHLGRWIYLVDARDDFAQDKQTGAYNPLLYRYGPDGDDAALAVTLEQSLNLMRSAYYMLEPGCRGAVLENVLYLGLPLVQKAVFDGSWSQIKKQKIWRTDP